MAEPAEILRRSKEEKTPEEKRKELKVIKGGGRKRWGPGAKAGAIAGSTAAVVSSVAAALGETDNLPDSLQGFYNKIFHPGKIVEEKATEPVKATYDVEEASGDLTRITNETKEQTKEETPPVIEEETPEEIEWEGMTITPIEGLRFDKGTFFAEAGNPYDLKEGEKAGVFVKDAVEINGVMESAIGLVPRVLEVMQKKIMEEEREFKYAFPINLEEAKGIKIREVELEYTKRDDDLKSGASWLDSEYYPHWIEGPFWDNNTYLEVSNVPLGTKIYAPVSTSDYLIWDNLHSEYGLTFRDIIPEAYEGSLLFKNERVDFVELGIEAIGINLLPPGTEKNIAENKAEGYSFLTETKMGLPIAEVVSEESLSFSPDGKPYDYPDATSIWMGHAIFQLKNENGEVELSNFSKALELGLAGLFKIENILVFISP